MKIFAHRPAQTAPATAPKPSRSRFFAGSLALLIGGWILGFYLFFPAGALKNRIEQEVATRTQVELTLTNLSFRFPPSLRIQEAKISAAELPQPVRLQQLSLQPDWLSLFSKNPGVACSARLGNGALAGQLTLDGTLSATGRQVDLNLPLLSGSPLSLAGTLDLTELSGRWPITPKTESRLQLTFQEARLTGLDALAGVPQLALGTLRLEGSGRGNAFKLERFDASGGDLGLSGSGTLLLGQPITASRVTLNLNVQPGTNLAPQLLDLLRLAGKPGTDGSLAFALSGTLAKLR